MYNIQNALASPFLIPWFLNHHSIQVPFLELGINQWDNILIIFRNSKDHERACLALLVSDFHRIRLHDFDSSLENDYKGGAVCDPTFIWIDYCTRDIPDYHHCHSDFICADFVYLHKRNIAQEVAVRGKWKQWHIRRIISLLP